MIDITIRTPRIEEDTTHKRFLVLHPSNGAILAYCDTRREAERFTEDLTRLANQHRGPAATIR